MRQRESIRIAKDQPILLRNKRSIFRRGRRVGRRPTEGDFWRHFDLEKFAVDWRRGVGKRSAA